MTQDPYLRRKDIPVYLAARFGYNVSLMTIQRWVKKHPLPVVVRAEELEGWFRDRMAEKDKRS